MYFDVMKQQNQGIEGIWQFVGVQLWDFYN